MPPKSKLKKSREASLLLARNALDVEGCDANCSEGSEHETLQQTLQTKPPASISKGYETDISTKDIMSNLEKAIAHDKEYGSSEDVVVEVKARTRHRSESKLHVLEKLETPYLETMYDNVQRKGSEMYTMEVR